MRLYNIISSALNNRGGTNVIISEYCHELKKKTFLSWNIAAEDWLGEFFLFQVKSLGSHSLLASC